jgi:hypothetical protein
MSGTKQQSDKEVFISIFLIGLLCLMMELIQTRMLAFFLGSISNFLAIPIALFGLALGSLYCHLMHKGDRHELIRISSIYVFWVTAATFLLFFFFANTFFSDIHVLRSMPGRDAGRLFVYAGLFLPAYFIFGILLSSYFSLYSHIIGRLYFFDLVGAGLGCLITSLLFTYAGLSPTIVTLLFLCTLLIFNTKFPKKGLVVTLTVIAFGIIQALAYTGVFFKEHPDPTVLPSSYLGRNAARFGTVEAAVEWNHIARSSLLRTGTKNKHPESNTFVIVQDDGLSNVGVEKYNPDARPEDYFNNLLHHSLPRAIGRQPKKILVMFAGSGKDMIFLDCLSDKKAEITGVELNPSVKNLALSPAAFTADLDAFFKKENIHYAIREGRDFLNHDPNKYDLIFVAANGAVHANRTGHTRKYLDTYEAVQAYLDHMTDDGMIIFSNQPIDKKVEAFRSIFKKQGLGDFSKSIFAFGPPNIPVLRSAVIQKKPFTPEETKEMTSRVNQYRQPWKILHDPYGPKDSTFEKYITQAPEERGERLVTDDRPFTRKVQVEGFSLFPEKGKLSNILYASNWIKIFTCILFIVVALVTIFIIRFSGQKEGRLPILWLSYFFVSGVSYMGVEIGLMGKIELFVGNPLYAFAVILACFLISNGIGAYLQDKKGIMRGPKTLAIISVTSILWCILCVELFNTYLLSIPMVLKVIATAIAVMPCGTALGMYYPFGVTVLVKNGKESTVPVTYGAATLSSVLGSALAMTLLPNFGFSAVILAGAVGYASVSLVYLAAKRYAL